MARSSPYWDLLGGPRRVIPEHLKVRWRAPNIYVTLGTFQRPLLYKRGACLGVPLGFTLKCFLF